MSQMFENIGRDGPRFVVSLLLSLQEKPVGRVIWLGFIGWDDESPEDEALPDFVVESECD